MLEIQNAEILNDVQWNIIKRKTKKTQIFLYDTQRRFDDYLMKLKYRHNGEYDDVPHYIITKTGKVYGILNPDYSSSTFNYKDFDKKLIKVAFENLGWLHKNTITGVLYNWIGDPYRAEPFVKKWRDYYFWDPYSDEQMKSIVELCKTLCQKYNIPYQTVPSQGYLPKATKFTGILCKSNYLNIYTDINPSFNFNIFYKDDTTQSE